MTSPKLFHLSYAVELDPQGHYVFYLGVKEFVYNNKSYKERYEREVAKRNRSNLNSDITVHRLGYLPKHRKSKYLIYRQGQNFDILPHKFAMTNEISLNKVEDSDFSLPAVEHVSNYCLVYVNHSKKDPYYLNPMYRNSIKETYDYKNQTSLDLPEMTTNVFNILKNHIPFENKNLHRFLMSSKIRNSVDRKNVNRELILDMYTMMDGYEDDDFKCLLQEKVLNLYNLSAAMGKPMYDHELKEMKKQLRTQNYPLRFYFNIKESLDARKDTLMELARKKKFRDLEQKKKTKILESKKIEKFAGKNMTDIMLMSKKENELFQMKFENQIVLINAVGEGTRKKKKRKRGSSSVSSMDLNALYTMLDANDDTNLNFSDSD